MSQLRPRCASGSIQWRENASLIHPFIHSYIQRECGVLMYYYLYLILVTGGSWVASMSVKGLATRKSLLSFAYDSMTQILIGWKKWSVLRASCIYTSAPATGFEGFRPIFLQAAHLPYQPPHHPQTSPQQTEKTLATLFCPLHPPAPLFALSVL